MSEETIPQEDIWTVPVDEELGLFVDEEVNDGKTIPRVNLWGASAVVKEEADNSEIILEGERVVNWGLTGNGKANGPEVITKNEHPPAKIDSAKMKIFNIAFVGKDREIALVGKLTNLLDRVLMLQRITFLATHPCPYVSSLYTTTSSRISVFMHGSIGNPKM